MTESIDYEARVDEMVEALGDRDGIGSPEDLLRRWDKASEQRGAEAEREAFLGVVKGDWSEVARFGRAGYTFVLDALEKWIRARGEGE